jgi:predicted phage terminase large subunit-like protein
LLLVDDPVKSREEADSELKRNKTWDWFVADFRSRGKPDHKIVIIQTRWHEDDLAGRILPENWAGESGWVKSRTDENWYVLCLPAEAMEGDVLGRKPGEWLWDEYYTPAHWRMTKRVQSKPPADIRNWNSLYQQQPTTEQGTYFQREWFTRYRDTPNELNVYITGDFAISEEATADYTEIAVWGVDQHEKVYVLDWWSGQKDSLEWSDRLLDMMARWRPVYFAGERANIEKSVLPFLQREMRQRNIYTAVEMLSTTGDKGAKARSFQSLQKAGDVYWPATEWADRVINQMLKFPAGKHDDAVDAASVFGRLLRQIWAASPPRLTKEESRAADHARLADAWNKPTTFGELMRP